MAQILENPQVLPLEDNSVISSTSQLESDSHVNAAPPQENTFTSQLPLENNAESSKDDTVEEKEDTVEEKEDITKETTEDIDQLSMDVNDGSSRCDFSNLSAQINVSCDELGDSSDQPDMDSKSREDTEDDVDDIPEYPETNLESSLHFDVAGTILRVQRATPTEFTSNEDIINNGVENEHSNIDQVADSVSADIVKQTDPYSGEHTSTENDSHLTHDAKTTNENTENPADNIEKTQDDIIADSKPDEILNKADNTADNTVGITVETDIKRNDETATQTKERTVVMGHKSSPGLARRVVGDGTHVVGADSDKLPSSVVSKTEKSEHLTHWLAKNMPGKETEDIEKPKYITLNDLDKHKEFSNNDILTELQAEQHEGVRQYDDSTLISESVNDVNVENEYDYIKYSRKQEGNMYVGLRLAASESADSIVPSLSSESSREQSPEKSLHGSPRKLHRVSEDILTDVSLNSVDTASSLSVRKPGVHTSPVTTECESGEVESLPSDNEKRPLAMPSVEDGLSSESLPPSDDEDVVQLVSIIPRHPAHQSLKTIETQTSPEKSRNKDTDEDIVNEDIDRVVKDFKLSMKNAKVPYKAPVKPVDEPVWVMRESYGRSVKRQQEIRKKREELARLQEAAFRRREEEAVGRLMEEDETLIEKQFSKKEGKKYQGLKGYESDEDSESYDEHDNDTRQNFFSRRKKYATLPCEADDISANNTECRVPMHDPHLIDQSAYYQSSNAIGARLSKNVVNSNNASNQNVTQAKLPAQSHNGRASSYNRTAVKSRQYQQDNMSLSNRYSGTDSGSEYEDQPTSPGRTSYIKQEKESDTDEETDQLLDKQYVKDPNVDIPEIREAPSMTDRTLKAKEVALYDPDKPEVLIEGVLFRASYLGSTQLISEGQPSKAMRMMQAQEAVGRIKAPEGESQPSTDVDLFVSIEKIMVLNTDLQEIMMDHALKTISYIADIEDIIVIMARRRMVANPGDDLMRQKKQCKIICHVFQTDEAQLISQSIGQAFQVAYMQFLKANGIEDPNLLQEIDYQEVLNQQEIFGEELTMFSDKDHQREVIVPKVKGEILGVVIVESGWGSLVPTVVIANMSTTGAAARGGQLNIGDQIISINGISLVGLPLSTCQNYIKAVKTQSVVQLTVVSCPPVVEVLIKRPDVKYQLGFSVQNGVICSLLRGGIAERGGVRVGHRIIEINNESVVAVPHEKIVNLLSTSVGEIRMKTMPTSIYRLLTGQEIPHYI